MEKIRTEGLKFVDSKGRTRLFNGMNIDDKHLNRDSFYYVLDEDFFKKYKENGFDFIRLAITWQNLEPVMGQYNEKYLKSIDGIFRLAEKYDVYILLDMHQDLYSSFDGKSVGDGAPSWAAVTNGAKPRMPKAVWAEGYFWGRWVHKSFDNFWKNVPIEGKGVQERYTEVWKMLAARYGDSPALFGYDLMNEPFPGTMVISMFLGLFRGAAGAFLFNKKLKSGKLVKAVLKNDTKAMLDCIGANVIRDIMKHADKAAAKFDIKKYSPFVNKTSAAIRSITSNGIIMMEQSYIGNVGVKQSAPAITVNGKREPQQCFGPHSYDFTVDTELYKYANSDRVKAFFTEMQNTQLRLHVPVVVGEWGGCSNNKDTSWFPHGNDLLDFFDSKQWSQAYWDYHGDDLDAPLMTLLKRTHPVAVAGEIKHYGYDRKNNAFVLTFDSSENGESIIYVHKPFTVEDGRKYKTLKKYDNASSLISFTTDKGEQSIKIKFED